MAHNSDDTNNNNAQNSTDNLLAQVEQELKKNERESLKAKLKDKIKLRNEAERTVKQLDAEMKKMISDFEAGL